MRVAAIDCGTNSIRLLIADLEGPDSAAVTDVLRRMTVVRLGEGIDQTGAFSEAALQRCFAAVEDYAELIREHHVEGLRFVATSATREAANRHVFFAGINQRLRPVVSHFSGPEVISGSEEARLSFAGAASVMDWDPQKRMLVVDLGGGSTEFVLGTGSLAEHAISTDMGCVRFTERYMRSDPPSETERCTAASQTLSILEDLAQEMPLETTEAVIGVAGTVTTVAAHALQLQDYDADTIHGADLSLQKLHDSVEQLVSSTAEQRAAMGFMHPGRVDVIAAGALIWGTVLDYLNTATGGRVSSAIASEHDILDGIAMSVPSRGLEAAGGQM